MTKPTVNTASDATIQAWIESKRQAERKHRRGLTAEPSTATDDEIAAILDSLDGKPGGASP